MNRLSLTGRALLLADLAMWLAAAWATITIGVFGFVVTLFSAGCLASEVREATGTGLPSCIGFSLSIALISTCIASIAPVGLRLWFSACPAWISIALVGLGDVISFYGVGAFDGFHL